MSWEILEKLFFFLDRDGEKSFIKPIHRFHKKMLRDVEARKGKSSLKNYRQTAITTSALREKFTSQLYVYSPLFLLSGRLSWNHEPFSEEIFKNFYCRSNLLPEKSLSEGIELLMTLLVQRQRNNHKIASTPHHMYSSFNNPRNAITKQAKKTTQRLVAPILPTMNRWKIIENKFFSSRFAFLRKKKLGGENTPAAENIRKT